MARFIVERSFAEQLDITADDVKAVDLINAELEVQWLTSFLSADKKKTYCLYEAPNAEAIRSAARKANLPVDAIIEVSELNPKAFA
jgi:hypothetical protein